PPKNPPPPSPQPEPDTCPAEGSIIDIQNQILGERVGVTGTPFTLNYRSNRAPGRLDAYSTEITLSGDTVPHSRQCIELTVSIAGEHFTQLFQSSLSQNLTNLSYVYRWDG